jgi:hypothetical protein
LKINTQFTLFAQQWTLYAVFVIFTTITLLDCWPLVGTEFIVAFLAEMVSTPTKLIGLFAAVPALEPNLFKAVFVANCTLENTLHTRFWRAILFYALHTVFKAPIVRLSAHFALVEFESLLNVVILSHFPPFTIGRFLILGLLMFFHSISFKFQYILPFLLKIINQLFQFRCVGCFLRAFLIIAIHATQVTELEFFTSKRGVQITF